MSLFEILRSVGWTIYPLLLCSILVVAFIVERFMSLKAEKIVPQQLLSEAIAVSSKGIPSASTIDQLEQHSPLGKTFAHGLRTLADNPKASDEDIRQSIEVAGRSAAHQMERFIPALATIAALGPLLGLLGTVIGMIEIFAAQGGVGGSGGANPAQLAHGISIALYNTAMGLIVAIPALIAWKYFRTRIDSLLLELELQAERFFRHLKTLRRAA